MIKFINKTLVILGFVFGILFVIPFTASAEPFILCDGFSYDEVPKEFNIEENEYIRRQDLRLLKVQYYGFDGEVHNGELVVAYEVTHPVTNNLVNVSKEVLEIFKELFEKKFPINEMSCFNFRKIAGTNRLSWHAYGLAIDINYSQNPCLIIGENNEVLETIPANLEKKADRNLNEKGMIKVGNDCYNAFAKRYWEWGGSWDKPKDYMHFQIFPWDSPPPGPKYQKVIDLP